MSLNLARINSGILFQSTIFKVSFYLMFRVTDLYTVQLDVQENNLCSIKYET